MSEVTKCVTCGAPVRPVRYEPATGTPANYKGYWCTTCKKPVPAENVVERKHGKQFGGCGESVIIVGVESQAVEYDPPTLTVPTPATVEAPAKVEKRTEKK